jgi:AraC-like DNA-binding protein
MDVCDDVIGGWVVALHKALLWKGVVPSALFEALNIDNKGISSADSRLSLSLCNQLYEQAVALTDDPLLPIKVSQCVVAATFHALGYSIQASASLKDAFDRLVRYERILSSVYALDFREHNGTYYLQLNPSSCGDNQIDVNEHLELTMLLSIVKVCRDLSHPGFSPIKIFTTASRRCVKQFQDYASCNIEFDAEQPMLVLDGAMMETRSPNFAPDLIIASDKAADEYLARLDRTNVVNQVRTEVVSLMATGATSIDLVAEKLNFSQRSLQRKLNDSGTRYKDLVEDIRQSMAEQYLNQNHLSLGEISYLLGFSNVANFSRAFKRWKGVTPGSYRGCHSHSHSH